MNLQAFDATLGKLNLEALREVNRLVVNQIKARHEAAARAASARFRIGDLVEFVSDREARTVRIRIERINAKSLSGMEFAGSALRARPGMQWRVSPHLCRLVGS